MKIPKPDVDRPGGRGYRTSTPPTFHPIGKLRHGVRKGSEVR